MNDAIVGSGLFQLIALGAVVMGMAHTIANERIFAPLRRRLGGKETWFGYLVSCPFCVSWWLALLLVPVTDGYYLRTPHDWGPIAWLISWFLSAALVVVIAAFFRVGFYYVDERQGLVRRQQRREELRISLDQERTEDAQQHPFH